MDNACLIGKKILPDLGSGHGRAAHAIWRGLSTRRQHDQTSGFQFEQQRACRHILELAARAAPVPELRQMLAHPPAAPVSMLGENPAHLSDLRFAEESALNDARFEHNPDHGGEKIRSPIASAPCLATTPVKSKT
ncbi:MAG: hypothetical protein WCS31_13920 [Verrucomicrobiae bacterium]